MLFGITTTSYHISYQLPTLQSMWASVAPAGDVNMEQAKYSINVIIIIILNTSYTRPLTI